MTPSIAEPTSDGSRRSVAWRTSHRRRPPGVALLALLVVPLASCSEAPEARDEGSTSNVGAALLGEAERLRQQSQPELGQGTTDSPLSVGSPAALGEPVVPLGLLGYTLGRPDAPIQVVEFSDFGCGYCRQFHQEIWPELRSEYVETGKVEWKYVPIVLAIFGPNAETAAVAGDCSIDQGRFVEMSDRLFENQREWRRASDVDAILGRYAAESGLDVGRWEQCVAGGRAARIQSGGQYARQAGLRGTPTFFVVGEGVIPGALPIDLFREILDGIYEARTR